MLKFMSFSSGSCGNCYYIGTENSSLLIDAGVGLRSLKKSFDENGLDMEEVAGILVTHDHQDHVRHLGSFCKRLQKPVYATDLQYNVLARRAATAPYIHSCRRPVAVGKWMEIGPFRIFPFEVPHDAAQTVGYAIEADGYVFVIMTDIGRMTDEAVMWASEASAVVVESNYDMDMLIDGPYTFDLKMRIIQGCGHLSNDECASALKRFYHPGLKHVFLCHLSENNNTADLAYAASATALSEIGVPKGEVSLRCLPRTHPSPLFNL